MQRLSTFKVALALVSAVGLASQASAQAKKQQAPMEASAASANGAKDFALSIPVALYGEGVARIEFNLDTKASLALEGNFMRQRQDIDEEQTALTGESVLADAKGALLLISRYSDPVKLAGFYWSMGVGFRQMTADWAVRADPKDKNIDLALLDYEKDQQGVLHHKVQMNGTTGHLRGGYRYVADEMPLMIGLYAGVRHFQAKARDLPMTKDEEQEGEKSYDYAPMTERERETFRRRYTTQIEPAIELGFIF